MRVNLCGCANTLSRHFLTWIQNIKKMYRKDATENFKGMAYCSMVRRGLRGVHKHNGICIKPLKHHGSMVPRGLRGIHKHNGICNSVFSLEEYMTCVNFIYIFFCIYMIHVPYNIPHTSPRPCPS